MKKSTSAWLSAARDDLLLIEQIYQNEALTHLAAFHAQQAIEKVFKAVLEEFGDVVPRVHSLEHLLPRVKAHFEFSANFDLLEDLDKLYIDARYPGDLGLLPHGKPELQDAAAFMEVANDIYQALEKKLILE
jgi:HEPN domain-containing protein